MKRKILFGIVTMAIAAVAAWNINISSQTNGMSDLSLANVEALADPENEGDGEGEGGKKCKQLTSSVYDQELCGSGYLKSYRIGVSYSCGKGEGSSCKSGFVGTYTDCSGKSTNVDNLTSGC